MYCGWVPDDCGVVLWLLRRHDGDEVDAHGGEFSLLEQLCSLVSAIAV